MALLMSRAGPRNPPAPRESAEEQSQGCCEGAGSEQPCPRHRSAGQEAGEGAEDPAAGHQPQTRTGNKAEGGGRRHSPGSCGGGQPTARGATDGKMLGEQPGTGGEPYCRERTLPRRFIRGGQPEYTHTHTGSHSPPQPPGAMPAASGSLGGI